MVETTHLEIIVMEIETSTMVTRTALVDKVGHDLAFGKLFNWKRTKKTEAIKGSNGRMK